jgi:hypothetical protein
MSAIVSVYAQKNGGLYAHPMGRERGMATRGKPGISVGMVTTNCRAVDVAIGTQ